MELAGLCNLADTYIRIRDFERARQILDDVRLSLSKIPDEYKKIFILSDLAILFSAIDPDKAGKYLEQGIKRLDNVEIDKKSVASKRIVLAIVRLNAIRPDSAFITIALEVSSKIVDPVEFVDSLIAVFDIAKNDKTMASEILSRMSHAVEKIPSPYEKASALLEIIPLLMQNSDEEAPVILLKKADGLTKKINIPRIADTIRDKIAQMFVVFYQTYNNPKYLQNAIEVTKTIDDAQIRLHRLTQMGQKSEYELPPHYDKINVLSEKIIEDGGHANQVSSLEKLIRSMTDRGKGAILFCDLAVLFRTKGMEKISSRLLQDAIKEAQIIRPLSRRAYIMCDIAMKTHASGCEKIAQEVLDQAIDAATNIRQSSLRDEVFDELGLAIKLMQGI
jgi:hypothetical protein